jgi:hypothetical protein
VKRVTHAPREMPPKGAQAACQRAPSLRLALLDCLAGLESSSTQLHQLPLRGVVGRLQHLGLVRRVPQRGSQAWVPRAKKIKKGTNPRGEGQQNKGTKRQLTFNLLPLHLESLGGGASTRSYPCPRLTAGSLGAGRPARDEEASAPCLEPSATMWPSHLLTSAPAWGSGAGVGRLAH